MSSETKFTANKTWQELTGVSGVAGSFTLQNRSGTDNFLICSKATTPLENDSDLVVEPIKVVRIENPNAEKAWVRTVTDRDVVISINKD